MNAPYVIHEDWQEVLPLDEDDLDQVAYVVGRRLAEEVQNVLRMRRDKSIDYVVRRKIDNLYQKLNEKWMEQ